MQDDQIKHMVNRFLSWRLPENFNPDDGISFEPISSKGTPYETRRTPIGTNLFDAMQAEAMVRYMVDGIDEHFTRPSAEQLAAVGEDARPRDWWKPDPEDPFWMLEAEDGEWLKNADSLLGTRDASKAIRLPTEQDAYNHPARMTAGSKWWAAKPTEHTWIARLRASPPSREKETGWLIEHPQKGSRDAHWWYSRRQLTR